MASFGPRRLPKVRQGGLLYKLWWLAIPRGVRRLKRVQTSVRAALVTLKADQRQIGGRTWPVLVPGGCRRSGKGVYYINFGGQLYQGVSDHLKGSKFVIVELLLRLKILIFKYLRWQKRNVQIQMFRHNPLVQWKKFFWLFNI